MKNTSAITEYNRCVDAHSDALYRFAFHRVREEDDAKDAVQEAYMRLWMNLDKVDPTKMRSYLFSTISNLVVDRARRSGRVLRLDPKAVDRVGVEQPEWDLKDMMAGAFEQLGPVQRKLIQLRLVEGYSYKEIAVRTGLDAGQARVYIHRARKFLKDLIGAPSLVA